MPTIRLTTTEVQVDDTVYCFANADHADAFEACVATVDLSHCEQEYAPLEKRAAPLVPPADNQPSVAREQRIG